MKATLEFNLPEDQTDFDRALKVYDYSSVVRDMAELLRANRKYCDFSEEQGVLNDQIEEKFYQFCQEKEIDPWS